MDRLKLLIADSSEEFRMALAEATQGVYTVRECWDGPQTLQLLGSFQPDILLLDLMLPGKDGISLLHEAAAAGIRPMVLATSRFTNEYVLDAAMELGVGYVMVKPCDVRATVARIGDLKERLKADPRSVVDPRSYVTGLLQNLGIPTKLDGYSYLREAIPLMAKDMGQSITKELYPAIGKKYGCGPKNVERSIRSAINSGWKKRDDRIWGLYFSPDSGGYIPRPTNAAFITRLADCQELTGVEWEEEESFLMKSCGK